ncbi:hypothetical protein Mycch_1339 [Mycolicibacterium chubuense NBB4]|uniref:Secreted protein n=1 Tax=Mycolicibacterium chubuense (strain NBB4) TaxID=710421 RepID=I4BFT4_MYCCN|nr:hypothetical protein [Mycolicibacterium chubuense]AFM16141.1 hypothetical protein Mycch_1339 [Mycolicibacterium chubuense NBB4]
MSMPGSRKAWAVAAAGAVVLAPLAVPAVASASPARSDDLALSPYWVPNQPPPPPGPGWYRPANWYHPEWGPGWNNGYPDADWMPPANWGPPEGWTNPTGWSPPHGWIPPSWWCDGPIRNLIHLRCW